MDADMRNQTRITASEETESIRPGGLHLVECLKADWPWSRDAIQVWGRQADGRRPSPREREDELT